MNTLTIPLKILVLVVLLTPAMAQRSASRWSNYDAVMTYRIGMQSINLGELNQALQQAGYGSLPSQVTTFGLSSQFSSINKPLAFHTEFGGSMASKATVTNGAFKAKASFFFMKLGGSYSLIHSDKFQLGPQLGLLAVPFLVSITPNSNTTLPLNTVLTNPGSAQKATLSTSTVGIDAGLTGSLRIPYSQRQLECNTLERSLVIGLDAGYRFTGRPALDASHEISVNNPAIQLSGWYVGLRLGFGTRLRSSVAPVRL